MTSNKRLDLGSVKVHEYVLAEIISATLSDISGVSLIQPSFSEKLLRLIGRKIFPGVHINVDQNQEINLELKIVVHYGINIPDVARKIQDIVKQDINKALDINVHNIDINIHGIERG